MLRDNFWLDREDARNYGIVLQKEIEFEGAQPVVESMKIPGSDRDIVYYDGSFSNVRGIVSCYFLGANATDGMTAINSWLMATAGYRRLEVLHEHDYFRLARVVNGAKLDHRVNRLNGFEIEFDCDPFKYFVSGEIPISVNDDTTIAAPSSFKAFPVITVAGSGAGTITVNDETISLTNCNGTVLDSKLMKATRGGVRVDSEISGTYPVFVRSNDISFSGGVTGLTIVPNWRCI